MIAFLANFTTNNVFLGDPIITEVSQQIESKGIWKESFSGEIPLGAWDVLNWYQKIREKLQQQLDCKTYAGTQALVTVELYQEDALLHTKIVRVAQEIFSENPVCLGLNVRYEKRTWSVSNLGRIPQERAVIQQPTSLFTDMALDQSSILPWPDFIERVKSEVLECIAKRCKGMGRPKPRSQKVFVKIVSIVEEGFPRRIVTLL